MPPRTGRLPDHNRNGRPGKTGSAVPFTFYQMLSAAGRTVLIELPSAPNDGEASHGQERQRARLGNRRADESDDRRVDIGGFGARVHLSFVIDTDISGAEADRLRAGPIRRVGSEKIISTGTARKYSLIPGS